MSWSRPLVCFKAFVTPAFSSRTADHSSSCANLAVFKMHGENPARRPIWQPTSKPFILKSASTSREACKPSRSCGHKSQRCKNSLDGESRRRWGGAERTKAILVCWWTVNISQCTHENLLLQRISLLTRCEGISGSVVWRFWPGTQNQLEGPRRVNTSAEAL